MEDSMKIWRRSNSQNFDLTGSTARSVTDYPPEILLYQESELIDFQASAKLARDADDCKAAGKVLIELSKRGQLRQLMTMRSTYRRDLEVIRSKYPNFSDVVDYLLCCCEIAWRTDKVLRFTPILLNGAGGIGKSSFCQSLADWMNHGYRRICISSSQNGSDLAGSSSFFSNARPGVPFTSLLYSDYANPLIFLDEIDKNTTSQYDALGALYGLLEKETAKTYRDSCYALSIDASEILWLAASNDADVLPEPLLTRFRRFDLSITPEQSDRIAHSIISDTIESLAPATAGMTFSANAMARLSTMTPRRIRQCALEAIGKAFAEDTKLIHDVRSDTSTKLRIGFLP